MTDIEEQLKEHLKNGKDWEKMESPVPGVYIVKVPGSKSKPAFLFLEINPLKEDGNPTKRKGLFVGSREMLVKFSEALSDDKVYQLIGEIEKVNPEIKSAEKKKLIM